MSPDPLAASPPPIPDASLGGVDDRLWVALERAASRVTAEWRLLAEDAVSAEEAGAGLAHLLGGMLRIAMNEEPDAEALPRSVLGRRLLAVLRRHFVKEVRALEQAPDAGQLLTVFSCFEQLYTHLESDWSKRFADRLGGAGGLELVVEVAHDFRCPLTSILFLAETLKQGRSGPVTPLQERQLGLIYSAAFGLSGVACDVVELARGGDRLVELEPTPFSIADIFESVRDIIQPIAEEKGLEIRLVGPRRRSSSRPPGGAVTGAAQPQHQRAQVHRRGRRRGRRAVPRGTAFEFSVRDSGRGIPPGSMVSLFEPFRRRQRAGEYAFSGSGLGLSICRKLVEAMGGETRRWRPRKGRARGSTSRSSFPAGSSELAADPLHAHPRSLVVPSRSSRLRGDSCSPQSARRQGASPPSPSPPCGEGGLPAILVGCLALEPLTVPTSHLATLFQERVQAHPDRELVVHGARRMTYAEVDRQAAGLAASLAGLGIGAGDKVAVDLPNWPEWIVAFLAGARLGATMVPVDPALSFHELKYQLRHSEARAVVTPEVWNGTDYLELYEELLPDLPDLHHVITVGPEDVWTDDRFRTIRGIWRATARGAEACAAGCGRRGRGGG